MQRPFWKEQAMQILRRYLDGMVEPMFKRDASGRMLFFPVGMFSQGRVLPDDAAADRVRSGVRLSYLIAFLIVILGVIVLLRTAKTVSPAVIAVGALAGGILGGLQALFHLALVRGLPLSDERLRYGDVLAAQSSAMGSGWMTALFAMSAVLTVGSAAALAIDPRGNLRSARQSGRWPRRPRDVRPHDGHILAPASDAAADRSPLTSPSARAIAGLARHPRQWHPSHDRGDVCSRYSGSMPRTSAGASR
jgi:hypothetical protein